MSSRPTNTPQAGLDRRATEQAQASRAVGVPIALALRLLRVGAGVSQSELGQRAGAPDYRTISHWETGRKVPSLRLLLGYLGALGVTLHDLQNALDQAAGGAGPIAGRITEIERRLCALERAVTSEG